MHYFTYTHFNERYILFFIKKNEIAHSGRYTNNLMKNVFMSDNIESVIS